MLAALLTVLICAYLYFVTASVLNVMASRAMSDEATQIQGSIGSMETEYFALSQEVTPQEGKALGLGPVSQTYYVYRPGNVGAASAATIARNAI